MLIALRKYSTLHIVRARELRDCQRTCSLPPSAAAVAMKRFGWELARVNEAYIKCDRDPFVFCESFGIPCECCPAVRSTG